MVSALICQGARPESCVPPVDGEGAAAGEISAGLPKERRRQIYPEPPSPDPKAAFDLDLDLDLDLQAPNAGKPTPDGAGFPVM